MLLLTLVCKEQQAPPGSNAGNTEGSRCCSSQGMARRVIEAPPGSTAGNSDVVDEALAVFCSNAGSHTTLGGYTYAPGGACTTDALSGYCGSAVAQVSVLWHRPGYFTSTANKY
jgi:hypothetical protein